MQITGSLQKKNGKYYSVIRIPTIEGKVRQKWENTQIPVEGKSRRETERNEKRAEKILQQRITAYESKDILDSSQLFPEWVEGWLQRKKTMVRTSTWEAYDLFCRKHILPYFEPMHLKIDEITPLHIQRYIDQKYRAGQSAKSIQKHLVVLHGVFSEALRFNAIPYDPCDRVRLPKLEKHAGKAYSAEQAAELISVIDAETIKPAVMLGLYLGLRRSEVLGLRWQDVDFEKNEIRIRNTVVKMVTTVEAEQTKSAASKRNLWMMPALKKYLLELKAEQEANKQLMGDCYEDTGHVCVWPDGRPFEPDYVSHRFKKILKQNDLPEITFHELRHSCGSILINAGVTPKAVQEYLGHEKVQTTLDIYTHLTAETKRETAATLDNLLNPL